MLQVKHISKTYYTEECRQDVLKDISFSLPERGLYFIVGKSGSGKSTLLNLIGGLDKPDAGSILFDGKDITKMKEKELSSYRARKIGFVFQEFNLISGMTVEDNLLLSTDRKVSNEEIDSLLSRAGLLQFKKKKVELLSGGEKQRVSLVRAILKDSGMILCDEPTGSLDSENATNVFSLLKEVSKERLVLVVTHDRESAEKYQDGIIEISDGKVTAPVTPTEEQKEDYQEEKGLRLSFGKRIRLAFSLMKKRPARMIVMLLISIFSFSFFGLGASILTNTPEETIMRTMYDLGTEEYPVYKEDEPLSKEDISVLNQWDAIHSDSLFFNKSNINLLTKNNYSGGFFFNYSNGSLITINDAIFQKYNIDFYYGRKPQNKDEVAISLYFYELYKSHGYEYNDYTNGTTESFDINSPEDLMNAKIECNKQIKKIVGIYDTHYNKKMYHSYNTSSNKLNEEGFNYYLKQDSFHLLETSIFTSEELKEKTDGVFVQLTGNYRKDLDVFTKVRNYKTTIHTNSIDFFTYECYFYTIEIKEVRAVCDLTDFILPNLKRILALFCSILLLLCISILLYYFSGLLTEKGKTIGVLQANGVKKTDIISVFSLIFVFFSLVSITIQYALKPFLLSYINQVFIERGYTDYSLFFFRWYDIFILLAICLLILLLGILLPTIHLYKQKSINLLREE